MQKDKSPTPHRRIRAGVGRALGGREGGVGRATAREGRGVTDRARSVTLALADEGSDKTAYVAPARHGGQQWSCKTTKQKNRGLTQAVRPVV